MNIRLLSFDIDNTLLEDSEVPSKFIPVWKNLNNGNDLTLCLNTGRLLDDTLNLIANGKLPEPSYIISGVGTNIYDVKNKHTVKEFSEILEEGWDVEKVAEVMQSLSYPITLQPLHFQNPYKSSWFFENATKDQIADIEKKLEAVGLDVNIVYSSSLHFDILPKWANKGNALRWLLKFLEISPEDTLVAGDSGNDSAMFSIPGVKGIVVANAQPELYSATKYLSVFHAASTYEQGLIEGLQHYHLINDQNGDFSITEHEAEIKKDLVEFLDQVEVPELDSEKIEFIQLAYSKAIEAIKKNITPLGFSACSIEDNDSNGTDENYHSVWARDGCITICGTISLINDPEIRACQHKTLETLCSHLSPNGQIPSNVRIGNGLPDYSGVGGICSIDSGLWMMIAFYDYVKATRDLDFLREHIEPLQQIMNWLSAHDGNNDALLEIPEAGDWTDLFGRSYNVLYDEVLWYRANICFGRMLEMLGEGDRAGDYLRWSQVIKKEILMHFWPSTQQSLYHSITFAEQQYSLGDARYLIAQVTPFDFSWRCDIFGNVLAYLYNVIDSEKASKAFRFMWGTGVNDPYPVANVYPAVHAGDPDWRSYYTVNLLNLPDHYHNGGIWPFVGGGWVRFINKLGLRSFALNELYKLAQLNHLGVQHEWEFNEWAHGKTGRPMGKAYQAWSASEFIKACHDLKIVNGKS